MNTNIQTWKSNGKLLITGEYLILEGALSLALPLRKSQSLSVTRNNTKILRWHANKANGHWFTADYNISEFNIIKTSNTLLAKKLQQILKATREISYNFLLDSDGCFVETILNFNTEFGFGTSSTLISNIAMWADVNPYKLLNKTFGGSGYDIACAQSNHPILYQISDKDILIKDANFSPIFKDHLYFVYLGNKQNSAEGISAFKKANNFTAKEVDDISDLTTQITTTDDFVEFKKLIVDHERIMSKVLNRPTVKSLFFNDFPLAVKSLGAWGGDFVMIACSESKQALKKYLQQKGFNIIFSYDELVLS